MRRFSFFDIFRINAYIMINNKLINWKGYCMIKGYNTVKEVSEMWGLKERTIQIMCAEGRIKGAVKFGRSWAIPEEIERPKDKRETSGNYKNWRNKRKTNY